MATVHTIPVDDLIEHDTDHDTDCVCGPAAELVRNDYGPDGWLIVHNSLDGRERFEQGGEVD